MKRNFTGKAGVAVVTAAFIGGLAPAASASTESKAGGAGGYRDYRVGVPDRRDPSRPGVEPDVTLRNTTGKTLADRRGQPATKCG